MLSKPCWIGHCVAAPVADYCLRCGWVKTAHWTFGQVLSDLLTVLAPRGRAHRQGVDPLVFRRDAVTVRAWRTAWPMPPMPVPCPRPRPQ